ncbi:antiviral reverse transcriptase Drt5 [Leptospira sarikeiensis]|uniref:Orotate phosphoribosyltransferase n=1 Tax=Leptospira sarikeiensis TaxID=2484943 RepID=A0A4R9K6W9_9LEPT|nr:antiviral reverse transcriptase Drt5 [Leptospira sarikeiensis]TGL62025.1 orotate phosphoribosyltransferase [Leptospira sarikeiensis]
MSADTLKFYNSDFKRTLFPLNTNHLIINKMHLQLDRSIANQNGNLNHPLQFLPQSRVFANKGGRLLRRTVKLDPFAEYFIYDLIHKNRSYFISTNSKSRKIFGYNFSENKVPNTAASYSSFKKAISAFTNKYKYGMKFDISSYFNSIYQHDLVSWFSETTNAEKDTKDFGQFLRQINSGRSVDCLPQGILPCKVIGSHFLKFIDNSISLKCEGFLRFMDDFYLFGNDQQTVFDDFNLIQQLLGLKGLNINQSKTVHHIPSHIDVHLDSVKTELLQIRRKVIIVSGEEYDVSNPFQDILSHDQVEYLTTLLKNPNIEEEDAELVLVLLRDYSRNVLDYLEGIIEKFPNLIKNIFSFSRFIEDKEDYLDILINVVRNSRDITEYQLFWIAWIVEIYLSEYEKAGELVNLLLINPKSSSISKAKILEMKDNRFGLPEVREEYLRSGQSDWLGWSSAVGSQSMKKISRNHLLDYFGNGSEMNKLIAACVKSLD